MSGGNDIVAVGGDLEPATLLGAYAQGLFPMRVDGVLAWWSPDPRGILPLDGFHRSRSLTRDLHRFDVRIDTAFEAVMRACADPRRPHGWIDESFVRRVLPVARAGVGAQRRDLGRERARRWLVRRAHPRVVRGRVDVPFVTNASKVALWAAVELLRTDGVVLFDVQWTTEHLESLGAIDVSRAHYLDLLDAALAS